MKTEIHLFLSSLKCCKGPYRYTHKYIYTHIYMRNMVLQKTLLWLSYVKLMLTFKAINKRSFVFIL